MDFSSSAHAEEVLLDISASFSRVMIFCVVMALWRKILLSCCSDCAKKDKYSCITCDKSVCVRSECSISEDNEENALGIVGSVVLVKRTFMKTFRRG